MQESPPASGVARRRRWLMIGVALAAALVWCGIEFRRPLFYSNFDVVDPGKVYRSAQPTTQLRDWVATYHLASIVNLRGGWKGDAFYAREMDVSEQMGVDFYDLALDAQRRPSRKELLTILNLLEDCRYPLLIHCKSGSDRTGLVCGLYRLAVLDQPPGRAIEAFSMQHGHIPLGGAERLHEPFNEYESWLQTQKATHSPQVFREWVERVYSPAESNNGPAPRLRPGPRPQVPVRPPSVTR